MGRVGEAGSGSHRPVKWIELDRAFIGSSRILVGAVYRELVSGPKSLIDRENAGNSPRIERMRAIEPGLFGSIPGTSREIP